MLAESATSTHSAADKHRIGGIASGPRRFGAVLWHPPNPRARVQRDFALAALSGIVQALGSVTVLIPIDTLIPADAFISAGTLLTLALLLLTYLNATAAQNTLIVKLVGASLILLLAVLGAVNIQVLATDQENHAATRQQVSALLIEGMRVGLNGGYPDSLLYIAAYDPVEIPQPINFIHRSPDLSPGWASSIAQQIGQQFIPPALLADPNAVVVGPGRIYRPTLTQVTSFNNQFFLLNDRIIEVGFSDVGRNPTSHQKVSRLIGQMILGTLLVLLVLPFFFWRSLIIPLDRRLGGVRQAIGGDLRVAVPVAVEDEIGYLTRSFNSMAGSLLELNEGLEQKVDERTRALAAEIVERQRVQEDLQLAKEQAEEANQAKSVFLANISHELRTPLNAILGYAQILQRRAESDDRSAAVIERSGQHLLTLINDILDLSKIEADKIVLQPQEVALAQFLQRVVDLGRSPAQAKGLTFDFVPQISPSLVVRADPTRLRQVLLNLLGNAARLHRARQRHPARGASARAGCGRSGLLLFWRGGYGYWH